jgi:hypothetical protein
MRQANHNTTPGAGVPSRLSRLIRHPVVHAAFVPSHPQRRAAHARRRGHHDQATVRLCCEGIDGAFQFGDVAVGCPDRLDAQRRDSLIEDPKKA